MRVVEGVAELGEYGRERWEALLEYLALPSSASAKEVSKDMKDMLIYAGLVQDNNAVPPCPLLPSPQSRRMI